MAKHAETVTVQTWRHSRKGLITGIVIKDDGEFVDIELTEDHKLRLASRFSDPNYERGEVISVRKSFLTEVQQ